MRKTFVHGVGGVVSADIAVPEHPSEVEFYSTVLTTGDAPLWRDDLMNNRGTPVIGLGERIPEYESLPLQWMPHIQVADVAASAAAAIELGGRELMHGKDQDGHSLWAGLIDPDGAAFGIIPAVPSVSVPGESDEAGPIGCISWLSLWVPDAQSSRNFYQRVVGWESAGDDGRRYEMGIGSETKVAEICQSEAGKAMPAVWLIHLPVDDLRQSVLLVESEGGEVIQDSSDTAIVRDPIGVHFAIQSKPKN